MVRFSELQKRIAVLLLHQPKTAEELNKQLGIPYDELMNELRGMLKLKVLSKEGFPTYYRLNEDITNEIQRRKEIQDKDANKIRLNIMIDVQAVVESVLEKELNKIKENLQKEKDFTIYEVKEANIIKEGEHFSGFIEVNLSLRDFRAITRLLFNYAPSSIEVIKPAKLELTADDLQDALISISDMVQGYVSFVARHLNKAELNEFREKLYNKNP